MRVDKNGSPLLPKREYNAKRKWCQPVVAMDGLGGFYDNIMILLETCRVAAYLNTCIQPTASKRGAFFIQACAARVG
jgi:hypothetical protein